MTSPTTVDCQFSACRYATPMSPSQITHKLGCRFSEDAQISRLWSKSWIEISTPNEHRVSGYPRLITTPTSFTPIIDSNGELSSRVSIVPTIPAQMLPHKGRVGTTGFTNDQKYGKDQNYAEK